MLRGAQDQRCRRTVWPCEDDRRLSARSDVLVFRSGTLAEDLEVTGPVVVYLWASSDGPDTDFTTKLVDVYPPNADFPAGLELNIGDGIVRGRFRDSPTAPSLLEPNRPYEFRIELYPTSVRFMRGHRIRIDVSSSNFPRFDINPNTGEPLNDNKSWRVAKNVVYHDASRPSRIILPVIPRASAV